MKASNALAEILAFLQADERLRGLLYTIHDVFAERNLAFLKPRADLRNKLAPSSQNAATLSRDSLGPQACWPCRPAHERPAQLVAHTRATVSVTHDQTVVPPQS